jgi:predicted MPP superfamily phosphohydrolase
MITFILVFLLLYGSLHAYFFVKIRSALALDTPASLAVLLFLLLMIAAPILIHILENKNLEPVARSFAFIGYIWMGWLFLFFCAALLLDIYHLLFSTLPGIFTLKAVIPDLSTRLRFLLPLGIASLIILYGYFDALTIRLETVTLPSPKIPAGEGRITIAQISDVHLGLMVREKRLEKIVDILRQAEPDLIVSTGDLVDGEICRMEGILALLKELNSPLGKYAVTGNHEFYAGIEQAVACTEEAGFRVLREDTARIGDHLLLIGVDDPTRASFQPGWKTRERDLLQQAQPDPFLLLLKHRPDLDPQTVNLFDLQLSGHTHKGQIFPFSLLVKRVFPRLAGFFKVGIRGHLYVSRGTGTWGPPVRFLASPEITLIELVHSDSLFEDKSGE